MPNILVTAIAGYGGAGVLKVIQDLKKTTTDYHDVQVIGSDMRFPEVGRDFCKSSYTIPPSADPSFVEALQAICIKEKIDLIIPSHEHIVVTLAEEVQKNPGTLPVVACNNAYLSSLCVDKYETYLLFSSHGLPFAKSILPSEYRGEFKEHIIKTRKDKSAMSLCINHPNPQSFPDTYIIQPLHKGIEMALVGYVTQEGQLLSTITILESNDVHTRSTRIVQDYDEEVRALLGKIASTLNIRGVFEVEAIYDQTSHEIIPFEVNLRISNTVSLRAAFGFEDVRWMIDELIYKKHLTPPTEKIHTGETSRRPGTPHEGRYIGPKGYYDEIQKEGMPPYAV